MYFVGLAKRRLASECMERMRSVDVLHCHPRKRREASEAPAPVKKTKIELSKQKALRVGMTKMQRVCLHGVCVCVCVCVCVY